jgi:8-oxo-dGTP pyrophosphatase MutT (NUDIX family)
VIDRVAAAMSRPAATLVLLRPGRAGLEVLLTRRPASMRFGANLFVFPGGSLDPGEDATTAAARETTEETGIGVDPGALVPLSRWVTPPSLPIRYDTRFFATIVRPGTNVVAASAEVVEWRWLRPTGALEAMAAGRLAMWQPTIVTLQQLELIADEPALRQAFAPEGSASVEGPTGLRGIDPARARRFEHDWAGGVEGRHGTTVVVGQQSWVVVDPGDPTGETSDRIIVAADTAGAELVGVVITGLEPEAHAGVEMLATGLGLPVAGPPGASGLVPYAVTELAHEDAVPFGDVPLVAHVERGPLAAPGRWSERAAHVRIVGRGLPPG